MAQDRHAEGAPVDAVVIVESPVFGRNDGTGERRRDVGERNPLQAPPRRVHAHLVDDAAVPVQELRIGEPVRSAHFLKGWKQRPGEIQSDDDSAQEGGTADRRRLQWRTSILLSTYESWVYPVMSGLCSLCRRK